jgi:hypothetical protein
MTDPMMRPPLCPDGDCVRDPGHDGRHYNIAGQPIDDRTGTVPRVPNKRKEGQKLGTFWLPQEEWDAAVAAARELGTTPSDECRRALRNLVKRAERKR